VRQLDAHRLALEPRERDGSMASCDEDLDGHARSSRGSQPDRPRPCRPPMAEFARTRRAPIVSGMGCDLLSLVRAGPHARARRPTRCARSPQPQASRRWRRSHRNPDGRLSSAPWARARIDSME
jgi:hypothetical protein